jgi:hypothetical protein
MSGSGSNNAAAAFVMCGVSIVSIVRIVHSGSYVCAGSECSYVCPTDVLLLTDGRIK